ncbi:hypothetical protein PFUGPA_04588 [Plasmodium falciparum Palo Alto/Uganda]|uniref:Uncharacterized protein n=3 Tax=Plasmodium falciparum TaxID=5833 RepID=W4IW25_PLAFP|nr:hypothetical protein PFUGPA_04588 [Plasmodium falciparum Palo Alto/Uganda]ETW63001.1 hypothetical protein PFMC_00982 [Plasmodium falciparum CAMP/Malaysia]EUR77374.1 hypothetical protein PFBG_00950 [Plasmodium falciparum 7G8]
MIYLGKKLLSCTLFVYFLYIHFFLLKQNNFCDVKVRERILEESINNDLSSKGENLHIYEKTNVSVQTFIKKKERKNLSDNNINDKINNNNNYNNNNNNNNIEDTTYYPTGNEKKENIFLKFFRYVKNWFPIKSSNNLKKTNINYEQVQEENEFSKYILQNNMSIETTKVCLIGSGGDSSHDLIKQFLLHNNVKYNRNYENDNSLNNKSGSIISSYKYYSEEIIQEPYIIDRDICNKKKNCKESTLNYENNPKTLIGNIIIQSDILKNEKIFNMNRHFVVCKYFGSIPKTNIKINQSTLIQHLIKCLDYCKMEGVQYIYIGYNIYAANNKLIEIMKKLREHKIIIVTSSGKIYDDDNNNDNNNFYNDNIYNNNIYNVHNDDKEKIKNHIKKKNKQNNYLYEYQRTQKDEEQKSNSSLYQNLENVISISGLIYTDSSKKNKNKNYIYDNEIKILDQKGNKKLNRNDISLFYFSYDTDIYEKIESDIIDDDHDLVSASFVNTLVLMHSINLKLSLGRLRKILNKSIVKREELRHLSNRAYYHDMMNTFEDSLNQRKRSYKIFYLELKNNKHKVLLSDANLKSMYQDNLPVNYNEEDHVKHNVEQETSVERDIYKNNENSNKNRKMDMDEGKGTYIQNKESHKYNIHYPYNRIKQSLLNDNTLNHKPYVSFLNMSYYNEDIEKRNYNIYDDPSYTYDQGITYDDNYYIDDHDIHTRKKRKISYDGEDNNDYHMYDDRDNLFHSNLGNNKYEDDGNVHREKEKDLEPRFLYDPFANIENRDLETVQELSELREKKSNNFYSRNHDNSSNMKRRRKEKKKKLKKVLRSKYDKIGNLERIRRKKKRRMIHKNKINKRRNMKRKNNELEERRNKQADKNSSSGNGKGKINGTRDSPKIKFKR